ncbi:MAG: ATP-binding protein [Bacillus sp. (in: Bacteria)]|nr:ATP-binding protein [Parasporobacterium sp.]MBR3381028.1 ATP-binding protein [Bacillus sp. (in: firmicutes)]
MPRFNMLIGLPGSGKSTFAEKWFGGLNDGTVILSSDAIREELWPEDPHSHQSKADHNEVFSLMKLRTLRALDNNHDVVYDATNLSKKGRTDLLNELKEKLSEPFESVAYVFRTDVPTCIERQNNRDRKVPEEVILRMAKRFEEPDENEGWDDIWGSTRDINDGIEKMSMYQYVDWLFSDGLFSHQYEEEINRLFYAAYLVGNKDAKNKAQDAPGDTMATLMSGNAFTTLKNLTLCTGVPVFYDFKKFNCM